MTSTSTALKADGVRVVGTPSGAALTRDVSLHVSRGTILGVVGESGSGKTTLALSLLGFCKAGTSIEAGDVVVHRTTSPDDGSRGERGTNITYIPQSPAAALNPALTIGTQLRECLHRSSTRTDRIATVLTEVGLPADDEFLHRYPHQLSGGQQQRVAIAMAFCPRPSVIVLDEPTTALDVRTQQQVLHTVKGMCKAHGTAAVYISHDLAVVAEIADNIAIMYSGRIVEQGAAAEVLANPRHPYTRGLLRAIPQLDAPRPLVGIAGFAPSPLTRPPGCAFEPRCIIAETTCATTDPEPVTVSAARISEPAVHGSSTTAHIIRCLFPHKPTPDTAVTASTQLFGESRPGQALTVRNFEARYGKRPILFDVNLTVDNGSCTALLGESGSGKTTLARSLAGIHQQWSGAVSIAGHTVSPGGKRDVVLRRAVQYIFQNPYDSLNPRKTVFQIIAQSINVLRPEAPDLTAAVFDALAQASLRPDLARRYPSQLSGGERQRVAIARALAVSPEVLVCDEITSALDVSVQATVVELLMHLRASLGLTILFVTHDIALVRNIADNVVVLHDGHIVEQGPTTQVFNAPTHPYTQELITCTPRFTASDNLVAAAPFEGETP